VIFIVPFNDSVFDNISLEKIKLTRYCYINDIDLVSNILSHELPIKNNRIALRNILDFLTYVDLKVNEKNDSCFTIPSATLIEYFGRDTYKQYMKILHKLNIISAVTYEDGSFYKVGSLYTQYRVHNAYINQENLAIIILDEDRRKDDFTNEVENLDERFVATLKHLEINTKEAVAAEIQHYKDNNLKISTLRSRINRIFYTKRRRFIKKGCKVNRVYHSFTNVSKVSRQHLNMKMINVDVTNCQPLLLVAHLIKSYLNYDENYLLDCENGNFYEQFSGINNYDRDEVKRSIYKNVFFSFVTRSKTNQRFKELYPQTWLSLDYINKSGISLASELQNLESELFNNLIPVKSKYFFTLFDAIYFDNMNDTAELVKRIKNFFEELGIEVKVKIGY
jgi:hypothetical protein